MYETTAQILLTLGGILLLGLATHVIGQRTFLPRVTLMLLFGAIIGPAMLPQADANMGMGLVTTGLFPEHRQLLLSVIISTTVFFALIGPVISRLALRRVAPA